MKKQRESNYELLKILAMLAIVLGHTLGHGGILNNTSGIIHIIFKFIFYTIIIHVNIFVMITGYFQYDKPMKIKKLLNLYIEILFYKITIDLILYFGGFINISLKELIYDILPFNIETYWFMANYIMLYLLSPFMNKLIKSLDKKETLYYLASVIICFSILPQFSLKMFIGYDGYNLFNMIMMYSIAAVIRKYDIINYLKNNYSHLKIKLFSIFCISIAMNISLYIVSSKLALINTFSFNEIFRRISNQGLEYNNVFVMIQAISLFLLFGTFNIHSEFLNKISSCTLAVYLIHESTYMRPNLYKWIKLDTGKPYKDFTVFIDVAFWVLAIFSICIIIELIRKKVFKILRLEFR